MVKKNLQNNLFTQRAEENIFCMAAVQLIGWAAGYYQYKKELHGKLYFELAEAALKKIPLQTSFTAETCSKLGFQYYTFKLYIQAERVFKIESAILQKIGLQNSERHARCLNNLGAVSVKLENLRAAKDYFAQSSAIFKTNQSCNQKQIGICRKNLNLLSSRESEFSHSI